MDQLREVLEQFCLNRLKLKPSKCSFFQQEIEYLGHHISAQGIWPSCHNLRATTEYPELTTYTSIHGFIGIVAHYQQFIKGFAKITEPLPVAFSNQALRGAKHKYHSTKFEFLTMKWGIHHFEMYLLGRQFKVRMDNNPLTCFMLSPNLDATKYCWIDELVPFTFSLEYQKGKNNVVADALSRIREKWLLPEETDAILRAIPLLERDQTVTEVFNEKEEDRVPERDPKLTMSKDEMKAVFDDLTMGAGRRAE